MAPYEAFLAEFEQEAQTTKRFLDNLADKWSLLIIRDMLFFDKHHRK